MQGRAPTDINTEKGQKEYKGGNKKQIPEGKE